MMVSKWKTRFWITLLILFNICFLLKHLLTSQEVHTVEHHDNTFSGMHLKQQRRSNQISINFDIMDIYRIDISCDYITRDLSGSINPKYINRKKECSVASLNDNVEKRIKESLKPPTRNYTPIYEIPDLQKFNIFEKNLESLKILSIDKDRLDVLNSVNPGGIWEPTIPNGRPCNTKNIEYIGFIIPYSSNRLDNLKMFILNMHLYLQTLESSFKYQIVVVEQQGLSLFNKGRLINSAFEYLNRKRDIDCVVIHDVDLIPTFDSKILKEFGDYRCRQMPWHLSNKVSFAKTQETRNYNKFLTGGILSLRTDHFRDANGFSNRYFGWGAEDDDFTLRMFNKKMCIMRSKENVDLGKKGAFTMLHHKPAKQNNGRMSALTMSIDSQEIDGLSNIKRLVRVVNEELYPLFTHLLVDVGY